MNFSYKIGLDQSQSGLGVSVRDSNGAVVAAMCSRFGGTGDGVQMHAKSVTLALQFSYRPETIGG